VGVLRSEHRSLPDGSERVPRQEKKTAEKPESLCEILLDERRMTIADDLIDDYDLDDHTELHL